VHVESEYILSFAATQCTATHCSALQRTATHCNALQHSATHCSALQRTTTHCNTLQRTATHYNSQRKTTQCNAHRHVTRSASHTLQQIATQTQTYKMLLPLFERTAAHCNTPCNMLQHKHKFARLARDTPPPFSQACLCNTQQHTATHSNTLQHTATQCNTLQHTATHCNTLQHLRCAAAPPFS